MDRAGDGLERIAADQQRDAGADEGADRDGIQPVKCARDQTMLCGKLYVGLDRLRRVG